VFESDNKVVHKNQGCEMMEGPAFRVDVLRQVVAIVVLERFCDDFFCFLFLELDLLVGVFHDFDLLIGIFHL